MTELYQPRPGSRTERAVEALRAGPMSGLQISDVLDCDQKQVTGILATAIHHGLVIVDKDATPYVYRTPLGLPPPQRTDKAADSPDTAAVCALAPPARPTPVTRLPRAHHASALPAATSTAATVRFGLFSDNTLHIEVGDQRLQLDATATAKLIKYLETAGPF